MKTIAIILFAATAILMLASCTSQSGTLHPAVYMMLAAITGAGAIIFKYVSELQERNRS